jgi:hypothetical protein
VQHAEREPARAAEVAPRRQPGGVEPARVDDLAHRLIRPVVDDDEVRDRVGLLGQRAQGVDQRLGAVPRDDDGHDRPGRQRTVHRDSSSASTSRPL